MSIAFTDEFNWESPTKRVVTIDKYRSTSNINNNYDRFRVVLDYDLKSNYALYNKYKEETKNEIKVV